MKAIKNKVYNRLDPSENKMYYKCIITILLSTY